MIWRGSVSALYIASGLNSSFIYSNLNELLGDLEKKQKMDKFSRFINHEEDVTIIKGMNENITRYLELYTVGLFDSASL